MTEHPIYTREDPFLRPSARVILLDPDDRILLLTVAAPDEETGKPFWFTPGGGLEAGETYEDAALRELFEETGIRGLPLGPCVWRRDHVWPWDEYGWVRSIERIYIVHTVSTEISEGYRTDLEFQVVLAHRWWSLEEMRATTDIFAPRRMLEILPPILRGEIPEEPIDVGV